MIRRLLLSLAGLLLAVEAQDQNTAIDFSGGEVEADGSVCVVVEEEQERVEQGKESQCSQQMVDQCYNSYVTTYKDVIKEKCKEVFVKTCRIELRERGLNVTTRVCKRPLVKECNDFLPSYGAGYGAPSYAGAAEQPEPQIVCRNLYETQCNTTHQVPLRGGPSLPVTNCDQVKRKICAEDHCRVVEGEEECHDKVIASTLEVPEETCTMAPETECKNVTTSIPQLIPQQECRKIPKEVCQTVFLNPKKVKTTVPVKYCTNPTTGVVEPVDDSEEDFEGDPRRSPRAELLQKAGALGFSQKQLLQQQQLLRKPAPQTALQPPFLPVPSVITGVRSGAGGRLGRFGRNKERLLRGRANSQLF